MTSKQKLELTWIGKEVRPRLEPRILLEDTEKSYHAAHRVYDKDVFDNILIHGDNLLALKALEQEFTGKIRCIYIDPPYNTGSAFEHYDDGVEHSLWLSLMRDRLEMFHHLLAEEGSIWITLDDSEAHYCKVLCDEIFGRVNFITNIVWQKKPSVQANAIAFSTNHDHILVYAKNKTCWRPNLLLRTEAADARYSNPDEDSRGDWTSGPITISITSGQRGAQYARTGVSANIYPITTPSGREIMPPPGTCWRYSRERLTELILDNRISFGTTGNNVPRLKRFLSEVQEGIVPSTWWAREEAGDNLEAKREIITLNLGEVFATPKPERLIQRIMLIATNPGDCVLDSFAGSGTTGAVAHKMGRKWIMVELGEHCHTHILPRLRKVVDGTDKGGVTEATKWKGGGGFRYFNLAPSLLEKDRWGQWVINSKYNSVMLTEALCKIEGFNYAPSDTVYWQQGQSTERDFLYVTTQNLSPDQLQELSDDVGADCTLLVLCPAFRGDADRWDNLTVRKIPRQILSRCEWGHDDYSLKVQNLPQPPAPPGQQILFDVAAGEGHSTP